MDRAELEQMRHDPAHWRAGLVYHCARDPRLLVPMRMRGTGYSVNFAQPRASLVLVGMIVLLLVPLALPLASLSRTTLIAAVLLFAFNVAVLTGLCHWEATRSR